jgi:phosphate transport system protein
MKLSRDVERISDEAVSIARRAVRLNKNPELEETHLMEAMYGDVLSLYRDAIRCYINRNLELAYEIKPRDKEIDKTYRQLIDELLEHMQERPQAIPQLFDLTQVIRSLERIGDHSTNIAEDAVYVETARDIRHASRFQEDPPEID